MGSKYTVHFVKNGRCPYRFERQTESAIKALCRILKLRLFKGYKIVTLEIRAGYTPCDECDADYCGEECKSEAHHD